MAWISAGEIASNYFITKPLSVEGGGTGASGGTNGQYFGTKDNKTGYQTLDKSISSTSLETSVPSSKAVWDIISKNLVEVLYDGGTTETTDNDTKDCSWEGKEKDAFYFLIIQVIMSNVKTTAPQLESFTKIIPTSLPYTTETNMQNGINCITLDAKSNSDYNSANFVIGFINEKTVCVHRRSNGDGWPFYRVEKIWGVFPK